MSKSIEPVEKIISSQYSEMSRKFRPVFGNQNHIYMVKDMGKLDRMEKELEKKLAAAKGGETLTNEIKQLKRSLLNQLKNS